MTLHEEALELRKKIIATAPDAYKEELKGKPWEVALLCAEAYFKSLRESEIREAEAEPEPELPKRQPIFPSDKVDLMQFLPEYLWYEEICNKHVSAEIFLNRYNLTIQELQDLAEILGYSIEYYEEGQYFELARKISGLPTPEIIKKIASYYEQFCDFAAAVREYSVSADTVYYIAMKAKLITAPCYLHSKAAFMHIARSLVETYDYTASLNSIWKENNDAYCVIRDHKYSDTEFKYLPGQRFGESESVCLHPNNLVLVSNAAVDSLQRHRLRIPQYALRFGILTGLSDNYRYNVWTDTVEKVAMSLNYRGNYRTIDKWLFIVEDEKTGELVAKLSLWED